jgi:hypothetical protein
MHDWTKPLPFDIWIGLYSCFSIDIQKLNGGKLVPGVLFQSDVSFVYMGCSFTQNHSLQTFSLIGSNKNIYNMKKMARYDQEMKKGPTAAIYECETWQSTQV